VSFLCLTQTLYKSRAFAPTYVTAPVVCLAMYYFSYLLTMAIFGKKIFVTKYVFIFYLHVLLETAVTVALGYHLRRPATWPARSNTEPC